MTGGRGASPAGRRPARTGAGSRRIHLCESVCPGGARERFAPLENVDKRQANKGFAQPGRPLARALCFIMVWATFLGQNDHSDLRFNHEILCF